eukprot:TRINITY_DN15201_c0_g1_i1.p1 TRINITY_DN15201_c0_g1~~TRINITY_DN15201_c0_g1_i1.p1  ORF type:complete len:186 (-),score=82.75 TRINITY_DN15201_c0_g1_i1:78-635(-)
MMFTRNLGKISLEKRTNISSLNRNLNQKRGIAAASSLPLKQVPIHQTHEVPWLYSNPKHGKVLSWYKHRGDYIGADERILTVEVEDGQGGSTIEEVRSPVTGRVADTYINETDQVYHGLKLFSIDVGETEDATPKKASKEQTKSEPKKDKEKEKDNKKSEKKDDKKNKGPPKPKTNDDNTLEPGA